MGLKKINLHLLLRYIAIGGFVLALLGLMFLFGTGILVTWTNWSAKTPYMGWDLVLGKNIAPGLTIAFFLLAIGSILGIVSLFLIRNNKKFAAWALIACGVAVIISGVLFYCGKPLSGVTASDIVISTPFFHLFKASINLGYGFIGCATCALIGGLLPLGYGVYSLLKK